MISSGKPIVFSITRLLIVLCHQCVPVPIVRQIIRQTVSFAVLMLAVTQVAVANPPLLSATVIQDSGVYGATELFEVYRSYLGRPVTDKTAPAIAESLRNQYAEDGFARPGYKILDSGEQSGIVRIRIVELKISMIDWSGSAGPFDDKVREMAGELPSDSAARLQDIRDVLRRARRLPGLSVDADTHADPKGNGGVVLGLDSTWQRFEGKAKLSNRGTREIGRNIAFVQVAGNGFFGHPNSVGLYGGTSEYTDRYRSGGVFATTALGSKGTSARLLAGASALRLDAGTLTEEHDRRMLKLRVSHPLQLDSSRNLTLWGAFALKDTDIGLDGIVLREDRLRSLEAGSSLTWRSDAAEYYGSLELEQGLAALGSSVITFNNPGDPRRADFTIARARLVRLKKFGESWSLRWDAYGQYSPHILPSTKRFKVGGNRIGRGFEAAAISGGRGIGNTFRLNRQLDGFTDWRQHTGIYGFYDIGTVWREETGNRQSAASTGIGVSFRADWLSGHIELAKPLLHVDEDGNSDARLFGEISMEF